MSTEVEVAMNWIESTLSGDITLQGLAPGGVIQTFTLPGTTAPYVLVKHMGSNDYQKFGGTAYVDLRFQVTADGPFASPQSVRDAASRINVLLTATAQTDVNGGTIIASFREQPISDDIWVDGAKWNTTGGVYKVMAKSS